MSSVISSTGRRPALLIAGILLIATTLRVVFTGAAPLLDAIRSDYGLTTAQTGLLTTLPLLAFGLVSPLAAGVARRFGMERSLLLAMLLICAGIALRSLPSAALLFIGTAVIGCGIALGNVLLPGLIKRDFSQHVARMTGAYSLTMGGAAALGSALVVPVAMAGFGWRGALLLLMLVLGQCADPLAHGLDQRNDKRIPHGEIAQSFRHPDCPIIREAVEPFAFDGR